MPDSMRARSSSSAIIWLMRSTLDLDAVEEFVAAGGVVGGTVLQGLDQRAEGREGRAQLVGDVGDEVAADGFGLPEVGEIAEEHQALTQAGDAKRHGDGVDFAFGGADG